VLNETVEALMKREYQADYARVIDRPKNRVAILPEPNECSITFTVELTYCHFDCDTVKVMDVTIGINEVSTKRVETVF